LWLVVVGAATVGITAFTAPRYRSEAKLLVRLGRENAFLDPTASLGQGVVVAVPQSREEDLISIVEILQSFTLAEAVVDAIGPEAICGKEAASNSSASGVQLPASAPLTAHASATDAFAQAVEQTWQRLGPTPRTLRDRAIEIYYDRLDVTLPRKSNVVTVSYSAESPELAQRVVAELTQLYLAKHPTLHRPIGSTDFFSGQVEELASRLAESEDRLRDLKNATGLVSLAEQQRILAERMGRLEDARLAAEADALALEVEVASLEGLLADVPENQVSESVEGLPNEAADGMRQKLYELELKEQELLALYQEDFFPVRQIREQIAEAREILEREEGARRQVTTARSRAHQELQLALLTSRSRLAASTARGERLAAQLAEVRADLSALNANGLEVGRLEREVALQQEQHRTYAQNLEQARIDHALQAERITNITVVQPASMERVPYAPRKMRNALVGLGVGLMGAVCLALLRESMNRSLRTPEEVQERLSVPVLTVVPRLRKAHLHTNGS
jgi:uncharacterized protein involved in exopolysaccharide biosynthesis